MNKVIHYLSFLQKMLALLVLFIAALATLCARRRQRRNVYVYLEGNIGVGKSTLAAGIARTGRYMVTPEPVSTWIDLEGHNFLGLYSSDRYKWSFPFQTLAQITLARSMRTPSSLPRIFERSAETSLNVFAQMALDDGILSPPHMALLRLLREELTVSCRPWPAHHFYIRVSPQLALQRARTRGREEDCGWPLEYHQRVHDYHERWVQSLPPGMVTILDGSLPPDDLLKEALYHLEAINKDL